MEAKPAYPNVVLTVGQSPLRPTRDDVKYFTFGQNNSGGGFHVTDDYGEYVIIAAVDVDDANERAKKLGLYFDGVDSGQDCECCGDRWSPVWREKGADSPLVYDEVKPEAYLGGSYSSLRTTIVVHHADGSRDTYKKIET